MPDVLIFPGAPPLFLSMACVRFAINMHANDVNRWDMDLYEEWQSLFGWAVWILYSVFDIVRPLDCV